LGVAGRYGFGTMMSSWTPFPELARQAKVYRDALNETPPQWRNNGARGHVDVARWVYVAETDAKAKQESEEGIMKNLAHFSSGHTSGYLGTVSKDVGASPRDYDALNKDILLHGSPATVAEKIETLRAMAGVDSVMLHYPPYYGQDKALASLELFATEVIPKCKSPPPKRKTA
jgi:alkanesulfonate monooxygenase SsuD/methylene tetrahydromethanopterin reductase-like flavin-dependent oxidoreductase (luciferase family)